MGFTRYGNAKDRTGSLITFGRKLTAAEQDYLQQVVTRAFPGVTTCVNTKDFDSRVGGPVWYIP